MKNFLFMIVGSVLLLTVPGCNTVRGFGEDISALGRSLSNATGTSSSSTH